MENESDQVIQALAILSMTQAARERGCDLVVCSSPETLTMVGNLCHAFGIQPPSVLTEH